MNTLSTISLRGWQLPATLGVLLCTSIVMGAQPQTTPAQFDFTGQIESFTLDTGPGCLSAPPSALNASGAYITALGASGRPALDCTATIVLNGQSIKIPANTVITLPASFLTPYELFAFNPLCTTASCAETGLAIQDTLRLPFDPTPGAIQHPATYEASIQGNIVYGATGVPSYIAGMVKIAQEDLNTGDAYINFIDYATGTLYVGGDVGVTNGTRLKINDPVGRYGRRTGPAGANGGDTQDIRFAVDDGNPTISAQTGYPLCIPRFNPAGATPDALCPESNRPIGGIPVNGITMHAGTFYMPPAPNVPDPNIIAKPANFPALNTIGDPTKQAPLEVGDFIHWKGTQAVDATGKYVSANTISADMGIYTTPGVDPAYITQEVTIVGLGPATGFAGLQEGRELFKVVGFTTDVARMADTGKVVTDPCNGTESFVNITSQWPNGSSLDTTGQAVANVPLGRFRSQFLKGINLGVSMIPATKEIRSVIRGSNPTGTALAANGLLYGQYQAPVSEFIFPENLGFGSRPIVPNNFEAMQFLSLGHGPWDLYDPYGTIFGTLNPAPTQGQLKPWPGASAPASVTCTGNLSAPPVIPNLDTTAAANGPVVLSATGTISPGGAPLLTFSFEQTLGQNVMPVNGQALNTNTFSFTAPGKAQVLGFSLTVCDVNARCSTKAITVTVTGQADALNIPTAPTYKLKDGSWTITVNGTDATAAISAHAFNQSGTDVLTIPLVQTPGQAVWSFNNKATTTPNNPSSLTVRVTSSKGGSVGPIGVVFK